MMNLVGQLAANLFFWLWLIGLIVLWRSRRATRRRTTTLVFLAALWLLCTRPVAELLVRPLEGQYPQPAVDELARDGVRLVVVLTGGGFPASRQTLSSALPGASLYRFIGGLELCSRLGPECRIVFSGSAGRGNEGVRTADVMRQLSSVLDADRVALAESLSNSTSEHPVNLRTLISARPFALVTSAYHMPRSMRSFRRMGLEPVPYPVDFLILGGYGWNDWLPSAGGAWTAQQAFREYVALVFYAVTGR